MKKFVILLFVAMAALSAKAQVYVGGTVSLWHNDDVDATTFTLNPEVGYNLNEKWAVGGILTFSHSKLDEGKYNAFGLAPYARYSYYENKVVRLFIDGGLGFSTQKVKGADAVNGFEIGFQTGHRHQTERQVQRTCQMRFPGLQRRLYERRQRLRFQPQKRRPLIRFPLRILINTNRCIRKRDALESVPFLLFS